MRNSPLLSIVIPVYWNSGTLELIYEEIVKTFDGEVDKDQLEIVFIDDASGDNSYEILCDLADRDPGRVRVLQLSRNFGSHPAVLAGLRYCSGKYAAVIGADLQEHPDLVRRMLREAENAESEVVLACRAAREESRIKV